VGDEFQTIVSRKAANLAGGAFQALEDSTIEKRLRWCRENLDLPEGSRATPRLGYESLMLRYLGLTEDDVPVVSESEANITWLSRNRCPMPAACQSVGISTSVACRAVYEKSTQVILSQLDPELRFHRDYGELRPDHHHCKATILRLDFDHLMSLAIAEAEKSRVTGNKGYGAAVVMGDRVLASAYDTATSMAEGKARIRLGAQEIVDQSPGWMEVVGGVLKEECMELYR
jgi:hypothetical protein